MYQKQTFSSFKMRKLKSCIETVDSRIVGVFVFADLSYLVATITIAVVIVVVASASNKCACNGQRQNKVFEDFHCSIKKGGKKVLKKCKQAHMQLRCSHFMKYLV